MSDASKKPTPPSWWRRVGWIPIILVGGGVAIAAEEVVVKAKHAEIFAGKTGIAKTVATVDNGEHLTVVAREGNWLQVRTPAGQEGFVKEAALTGFALTAGGRPVSGSAQASALGSGNAVKGLEPGSQDFARQNNISPRAVNDVNHQLDLRKSLEARPEDFSQWQKEGGVGTGRP